MVRRSTFFLAILSAQASRGHASRLTPTDADLHAAESTSAEHVTAVTGLQSDITAVGNELRIDAARHNSSGGVASTHSHVALAGNRWKDTALAVGLFLLGVMVASLCFASCIKDRRLSDELRSATTVQTRASSKDMAPSPRWEVWSPGNNEKLGPLGIESSFAGMAPLLDSTQWDSVSSVTGALNCKLLAIEEGYCIVWSSRMKSYYLIWRDGRKSQAHAALNLNMPRKVRFETTASWASSDDDVDEVRQAVLRCVTKTASWASSVNAVDGEKSETFALAPPDNTALYDSLRQLSERIQGPVTKFPSGMMNALVYGKTSRYIVVALSSEADPGSPWRKAQINFFLTVDDFEQGSDPQISVRVCDIMNVSRYHPSGSDPQIVLTINQQAASSGSRSDDSPCLKEIYFNRETRNETEKLQKALLTLSDLVCRIQ